MDLRLWLIAIAAPFFNAMVINDSPSSNSAYSSNSGSSYSSSGGWSGGGSHK